MLTLYSKNNCGYCLQAKALLKNNDIPFEEVNIDTDDVAREFVINEGHRTMPQIYREGALFVDGGYQGLSGMGVDTIKTKLGNQFGITITQEKHMLYNIPELLGEVVTLKTTKGDEIITRLIGYDKETDTMTLAYPKIVVVAGDAVALAPFALTSRAEMIITESKHFLAVMEPLEETVKDYNDLIVEQQKLENGTAEFEEIHNDETLSEE